MVDSSSLPKDTFWKQTKPTDAASPRCLLAAVLETPWPLTATWASWSQNRMGPWASWPLEAGQPKGRLRPWGLLSKTTEGQGENQVSRLLDLSTTSPASSEISNGKVIPRWGKKRVIFSVLAPCKHLGRGGSPTDPVQRSWVMSRERGQLMRTFWRR